MKNYGLDIDRELAEQSDEDYVYGAFSPVCSGFIPEEDRTRYLPKGEVQRGVEDTMDCATRGPLNFLETKFNRLYERDEFHPDNRHWLEDNNFPLITGQIEFSDAFTAIKSGTTKQGNSLKAPLQAINDFGLIPKEILPLESWMTFDDYHNPDRITKEMERIGKEFKRRFPIYYEKVYKQHYGELYKEDMLIMAGFAWSEPVNGEYPRTEAPYNHVFLGVSNPRHFIFDNYIDVVDGDFLKKLAADYDLLGYGYRVFLQENKSPQKKSFYQLLKEFLHL